MRLLRLRLLGLSVRCALNDSLPSLGGRVLLAALARYPNVPEESFDFVDYTSRLSRWGLELAQVRHLNQTLCSGRAPPDLTANGVAATTVVESILAEDGLAADLLALGMPVNTRALRWSESLGPDSPPRMDPWASLSWSEITTSGPAADAVIDLLSRVGKFATGDQLAPSPESVREAFLWQRELHFDLWRAQIPARPEAIRALMEDRTRGAGDSPTALGMVRLEVVRLSLSGVANATRALKSLGIPESDLGSLAEAWRRGDWNTFHEDVADLDPRAVARIAESTPPADLPELTDPCRLLIEICRRRLGEQARAGLSQELHWVAELVSTISPQTPGPEALDPLTVQTLAHARSSILAGRGIPSELSADHLLSLALFARRQQIDVNAFVVKRVDELTARTAEKLTCEQHFRPRATLLIKRARDALLRADSDPALTALIRALRDTNPEPFQAGATFTRVQRPANLGTPRGARALREFVLSRRMVLMVILFAIVAWATVTYLPGAQRRSFDSAAFPPALPLPESFGLRRIGTSWILQTPVEKGQYLGLSATTAPLPSAEILPMQVTRPEAIRWCELEADRLRYRYPSLFEHGGPFAECTGRIPMSSELEGVGATPEWTIDERLAGPGTQATESYLGATRAFRLVLAPSKPKGAP